MTIAASLTSLDLDSQIHLLSRVQFLTRFGSHLIQISGDEGAGKTWLAQRYLEQWADADGSQARQALLMCHPAQQDNQHRSILLNQLIPNAVFNDTDPLQQSLERLLEGKPVELLLVIDDAQMLSPALIGELWALVTKAQSAADWQVNVLLFSQTGRLTKALRQVSHGQGQAPLELEIPPLSEPEVQTFLELVLSSHSLDANQRRTLKAQAEQVPPTPGALTALNRTEVENMASSSSRTFSPLSLLAVLLALVVAAGVFWYFPSGQDAAQQREPETDEPAPVALDEALAESETQLPQATADTTLVVDEAAPSVLDASETEVSDGLPQDTESADTLPPPVKFEGLTVGRSGDTGKRVVVPSDLVDAMITEQETGGSGEQAVAGSAALNAAIQDVINAPPEAQAESDTAPQVTETPAPTQTQAETEPVAPFAALQAAMQADKETLKAVNSRHYALQLAAMHSLEATRSFLTEYGIQEIAQVYQTQRQGVRWYIVVTGDFATVAAARQAQSQLPDKVQAVQPWVKSYTQIHREIDRSQ
ncbi:AAA family ATPase [Photobacterium sp. GJ3]|uniref:AAA family ATPase n=1 Tax=Photobacterium sp. GJ3 TaxID=2829502 RepID=UPI001B8BBB83|nr:AAA family ATPase [Photobacterium sp. GJ3]QUJ67232.1 AAA family ATPase [Photobacterium sp. GJ3]